MVFMIAPISLGKAHEKGAAPAPSKKLEGQSRILGDAFQPTYDQSVWPAIMAWRGRALVRRRRDGEVQIIRTESVLMPSGYCSVSATRLLPGSSGLCDVRRAPWRRVFSTEGATSATRRDKPI
jgi:hypothetical protein